MRRLKWLVPGLALLAGVVLVSRPSSAQPDYTKKERLQCTVCHQGSWTSGKYTPAGQYYREHHTFKGYHPPKPAPSKQPDQQAATAGSPLSVGRHSDLRLPNDGT